MRLAPDTVDRLPKDVHRHSYDRVAQAIGIVHFGIGAFHRAHQAWYTDLAMSSGEPDWAICGVSLRSASVAEQLNPQGGLYTLTERSGDDAETLLIGSVKEVLVAARDSTAITDRIASADCHVVSFTVTEKGYCRAGDGSLDSVQAKGSFYPLLAEALAERMRNGLPGLTLMSCDNLAHNGKQLARLLDEYLAIADPALAEWAASHCTFPSTMVDRIVPATTAADLDALESRIGLRDEGAVFTERFSQWVIEDSFAGPRPGWEKHGAQLVADVAPFETAKLRMLNGAHSALAYLGLERGHDFVHQAIADPEIGRLIDQLMLKEAATSFTPAEGQDLPAYAEQLIQRFADSALNHRLNQIAMDGSQKIPQRWLETLAAHQESWRECPAILTALGAWIRHIRGDGAPINDPMAERLKGLWKNGDAEQVATALFGPGGLFADYWQSSPEEIQKLK